MVDREGERPHEPVPQRNGQGRRACRLWRGERPGNLETGSVDILLLSDRLRESRLKIRCGACGYSEERTIKSESGKTTRDIELGNCPKCSAPLQIEEESDIIDELTALADASGTKVEIISDEFEEGSVLYSAFGGIAAILRYRTGY